MTPEEVIRDHAPKVFTLARRILGSEADAEDVTQDVLMTVVRKLPTYRGDASIGTWLHRITVNAALGFRRKRARRTEHQVGPEPLEHLSAAEPSPGEIHPWALPPDVHLLNRETRELIELAIGELPETYRDVYVLADVESLPNAEIADMLGLQIPAVKSRLHRARLLMRQALAPHFEERVMIDCTELDRLLVDYVANELPAAQRLAIDTHLPTCRHCRAHLESYRILISISAHLPTHALPEGVASRLQKGILAMLQDKTPPPSAP